MHAKINSLEQKEGTELTPVITPYILYFAFQAILRMFKLFPEEFVSTFDAAIVDLATHELLKNVDENKKEHPHYINKMPVPTCRLKSKMIIWGKVSFQYPKKHHN